MRSLLLSLILLSVTLITGCSANKQSSAPQLSEEELNTYLTAGKEHAVNTQKILAGNLIPAVQERGSAYAVAFCHLEAQTLTDSMATELKASIRRVTDQPRNPANQANHPQLEYIDEAKTLLSSGTDVPGKVFQDDNRVIGYYPIITNQLCMQCYGNPEQIEANTLTKLKNLYPDDKATGYDTGELRGIWVVEMGVKDE